MANAMDHKKRMAPVRSTDTPATTPEVERVTSDGSGDTVRVTSDGANRVVTNP